MPSEEKGKKPERNFPPFTAPGILSDITNE